MQPNAHRVPHRCPTLPRTLRIHPTWRAIAPTPVFRAHARVLHATLQPSFVGGDLQIGHRSVRAVCFPRSGFSRGRDCWQREHENCPMRDRSGRHDAC
jgi:hypothetical protein